MAKSKILQSAVFVILMAGLAFIRYDWQPARVEAQSGRKLDAQFTLKDAKGKDVKLSDYRGKVVLLNFWATWCGPCKDEIPWFIEFEKTYGGRGLAVVGVSMDEDGWKVVTPYVQNQKMNYPVLLGNEQVAGLYARLDALPTTLILDRAGQIASAHTGLVGTDTYAKPIEQLLAEK